uniref:ABC transporter substrate-binding protein n=1 Tax=Desulfobacca acetoxidans TaxID=60893 RepID=A0A7C5ALK8_9BACT
MRREIPENNGRLRQIPWLERYRRGSWCLIGLLLLLLLAGCSPYSGKPLVVFASPLSLKVNQVVEALKAGLAPRELEVLYAPEFGPEGEGVLAQLRKKNPGLIIALGSPALLRLAALEKRTPVVFGMVANPYILGVAHDPQHPEIHQKNITGLTSPPPVKAALEQGAKLFGPCPWGLLYDPGEGMAAELAQLFVSLAPKFGLIPLLETSTEAQGDLAAMSRLQKRGARVLYLPPTATAARYAPLAMSWGRAGRVLVVSSLPQDEPRGAVLRVTLDYQALGQEIAVLVRKVLAGEKPEFLPIRESSPLKIVVDEALWRHWQAYPLPPRGASREKGGLGAFPPKFNLEEFPS